MGEEVREVHFQGGACPRRPVSGKSPFSSDATSAEVNSRGLPSAHSPPEPTPGTESLETALLRLAGF